MCNAVLTTGGTVHVKELVVIAHAIASRGRGIPYYRCQLPTSISCREKWPLSVYPICESKLGDYPFLNQILAKRAIFGTLRSKGLSLALLPCSE